MFIIGFYKIKSQKEVEVINMDRADYPILEFDSAKNAVIDPSDLKNGVEVPEYCVLCFFKEVLDKLVKEEKLKLIANIESELGKLPIYEISYQGESVTVLHPGVGAPLSAGILEEVIAYGAKKIIACGGAGVLKEDMAVGKLVIPDSAIRDEGVSYHYLPPGREVNASPNGIESIKTILNKNDVEYVVGKTWTTSALFRETAEKVKLRKEEGCLTVEMESAAFFAIAEFRRIDFAQILYSGDDVSGEEWDSRKWATRKSIREKTFWYAVEASLNM